MIPQGEVGSLLQVNHSGHAINPQDSLDLLETKDIIAQTIDRLPKNERTVVALYLHPSISAFVAVGYTQSPQQLCRIGDYGEVGYSQAAIPPTALTHLFLKSYTVTKKD